MSGAKAEPDALVAHSTNIDMRVIATGFAMRTLIALS